MWCFALGHAVASTLAQVRRDTTGSSKVACVDMEPLRDNRPATGLEALHDRVRCRVGLLLAVSAVALGFPAQAPAHGNGQLPLHSMVTSLEPAGLSIEATTEGQEYDRLYLRNEGSSDLVVLDYQGEPYARVTRDAVLLNVRLGTDEPAKWMLSEPEPAFAYHDHRAHWMGTGLPRTIDPSRDEVQEAYRWTIPVRYGGESGAIKGVVYYVPPTGPDASRSGSAPVAPSPPKRLVGVLALVAMLSIAVAVVAFAKLRTRRPERPD